MADLGSLIVSMGADLDPLKQGMHQAEAQFRKFQSSGVAALNRVNKAVFSLQTVISGLAIGMIAKDITKTKNEYVKYQKTLEILEGSHDKANKKWQEMLQFAEETPFKIKQVMESYKTLKAFGLEPTVETMRTLGDVAAALGGADVMGRVALVLGQIKTQGFITAEDMNQLANAGINAGKVMEDAFGAARDEVALLKNQGVTANMIISALMKNMQEKFGGQMAKMNKELSGQWEMLISIWERFEVKIMDSGLYNYIRNFLTVINEKIIELRKEGKLDEWAKKISDNIINTFETMAMGIAGFWDFAEPLLKDIKKGMTDIWDWYKKLPGWIKKTGLILALFGGRSTKIGLGFLAVTSSKMEKLKKQIDEFQKEGGKGGFLAMLKWQKEKKNRNILSFKIAPAKATPIEINEKELSKTQKRLQKFFKELRSIQHSAAETKINPTVETEQGNKKEISKTYDEEISRQKKHIQLMKEGKALTESLLTPQEQYTKTIEHLNTLLDAGAISQETYNRALNKAEESIKGTTNGYEKLISGIDFEKSLLGKNKTVQRAMTMAKENNIKIGSEQYNQLLKKISAYDTEADRLADEKKAQEERLQIVQDFNAQYENLGKNRFEIERENLEKQVALWEKAGIDKERIARMTSKKLDQINLEETKSVMSMYADMAGGVAGVFQQIAQAGGKQSKEAFIMYKAFAVAQAGIQATSAILNTLASPLLTPPMNQIMAGVIGAMAAAKVAAIVSAQPPSYDEGGISKAKGFYQTGNIAEAHIPLKKGRIPVELKKQEEKTPVDVTILNAFDPAMIDEYMYSSQGQSAILNVIGNHSQTVRRVLR